MRDTLWFPTIGIAVAAFVAGHASVATAAGTDSDKPGIDFFERKIRPVLVQHCFECHSAQAKSIKGELRLDTKTGARHGGATGPAVVPGKPVDSLIVAALRQDMFAMPPKGKLPDSIIADFERWIEMGAPDPRQDTEISTGAIRAKGGVDNKIVQKLDMAKAREFWAFRPLRKPMQPEVVDASWPANWIDPFVLARLEQHNLRPSADAEPATLLRRLSIDLIGLPPTPDEVVRFERACGVDSSSRKTVHSLSLQEAALAATVDRLLASPQFGERWGRHWLDLARYADSNGRDENLTYHHAWRYRNYVIDSFNADVPYDRFVIEQLAGDLLPYQSQDQRDRQLIAAGFLVVGPKVLANRDKPLLRMDVADEQIDTCGRVFLGMTLGCARCHDHKFDPIPTTDYYALAGIFANTHTIDGIKKNNVAVSGWMERGLGPDGDNRLLAFRDYEKKLKPVVDEIVKLKAQAKAAKGKTAVELADKIRKREEKEKALKAKAPKPPEIAMAPRDEHKIVDCRVHLRGDLNQLGPTVARGFLSVAACDGATSMPTDRSGREQLARWIVDPRNPLAARVAVNRIWMHLLGEGLVRTCDNFGAQGEKPTHDDLLDALADRFMAENWSVKKLIRQIVMSRTYRQAVATDSRQQRIDPENRLLWRANRRRVEAEVLRDSMLAISGKLDSSKGGCPVPNLGEVAIENDSKTGTLATDDIRLRSVYLPVIRNELPPIFEVFDFADHDVATGKRDVTTVPTQALFLLHAPFVVAQAKATAQRLLGLKSDDRTRLNDLYLRAYSRPATEAEATTAMAFVMQESGDRPERRLAAWTSLCHAVFASTEFRFVE